MRDLKEVLAENRDKYIEQLKNLVAIDTHDLGHGIDGGPEKEGQDYMIRLFEEMGAETTVDPMKEEARSCTRRETWDITRQTATMCTPDSREMTQAEA